MGGRHQACTDRKPLRVWAPVLGMTCIRIPIGGNRCLLFRPGALPAAPRPTALRGTQEGIFNISSAALRCRGMGRPHVQCVLQGQGVTFQCPPWEVGFYSELPPPALLERPPWADSHTRHPWGLLLPFLCHRPRLTVWQGICSPLGCPEVQPGSCSSKSRGSRWVRNSAPPLLPRRGGVLRPLRPNHRAYAYAQQASALVPLYGCFKCPWRHSVRLMARVNVLPPCAWCAPNTLGCHAPYGL